MWNYTDVFKTCTATTCRRQKQLSSIFSLLHLIWMSRAVDRSFFFFLKKLHVYKLNFVLLHRRLRRVLVHIHTSILEIFKWYEYTFVHIRGRGYLGTQIFALKNNHTYFSIHIYAFSEWRWPYSTYYTYIPVCAFWILIKKNY